MRQIFRGHLVRQTLRGSAVSTIAGLHAMIAPQGSDSPVGCRLHRTTGEPKLPCGSAGVPLPAVRRKTLLALADPSGHKGVHPQHT